MKIIAVVLYLISPSGGQPERVDIFSNRSGSAMEECTAAFEASGTNIRNTSMQLVCVPIFRKEN